MASKSKSPITLRQALPYILLVGSVVGLVASFALTYDKIQVLKNPAYAPSCNINPVLSCGSVMQTEQASLLGVPNTIFGLMGFSALITLSVLLIAGATVKKWMWLGLQAGMTAGMFFMLYLFVQGIYRINAICPYCFAVWMIIPPMFWYTTLYNLREGNLKISQPINRFLQTHHGDILLAYYMIIFGLILNRFWYYWQTLI